MIYRLTGRSKRKERHDDATKNSSSSSSAPGREKEKKENENENEKVDGKEDVESKC